MATFERFSSEKWSRWMLLAAIVVAAGGLAVVASGSPMASGAAPAANSAEAPAQGSIAPATPSSNAAGAVACEPTIPPTEPGFEVPPTHPAQPSWGVWFGTEDLWTALPVEGPYLARKSVWWSARFPGGHVEERPDLTVTWERLDEPGELVVSTRATNAMTAEDGWFMIGGGDPDQPGCWRVSATYKGATLSYVYRLD